MLCVLTMFLMVSTASYAAAPTTQVDALIEKLIDKGILTRDEAENLKGQISYDAGTIQESNMKKGLPDWVQNLKVSGDFRLRDQYERRNLRTSPIFDRNRARIRARLSFEDQINDKVKVVVGIATDGGKSRSNNETLGGNSTSFDAFGKAGVVLNKGYAVYTPNDKVTLIGGKMDNPIWEPGTMPLLWKPDITPEGGAIQLEKKLNAYITPFTTNAAFILHDAAPTAALRTQPYMFVSQGGIKGNLTEKAYYKAAASYYNVNNPSHFKLTTALGINTLDSTGTVLNYNYNAIVGAVDFGLNDPFGEMLPSPLYIPQIGVFGEYVRNPDPSHNNAGWQMGAYMGNSSINGFGTWRLQSYYRVLERDAWLDVLPDDDFYSGNTDTSGLRTQLDIGLAKNIWLMLAWYHTRIYKTFDSPTALTQKAPENLIQADINFRF